jgi:AraC-like DNA-binding protein
MDGNLCGHAAYGPYILTGGGPARHRRAQTFTCNAAYHVLLVEDGAVSATQAVDGQRRWTGPCGLLIEPASGLRITVTAGGRVSWLLFHAIHGVTRPRQHGPGRYHPADAPVQPGALAVWGRPLPGVVPNRYLASLRTTLAMACDGWWRGPLGRARAGHLLGMWLLDVLEDVAPDTAMSTELERLEGLARIALRQGLGLRDIAAACGLGPAALSARVRAVSGLSCGTWVARIRLDEATRLLRTTTMPASEVGRLCGWRSPSSFSRAFQAALGVPPATWRRNTARHAIADTDRTGPPQHRVPLRDP